MRRGLRHRRRIARALAGGRTLPHRLAREFRWLLRDLRDIRLELKRMAERAAERARDPRPFIRDEELRAEMDALAASERQLAERWERARVK